MSAKIMANESLQMKQIMKLLGMEEMAVISFELLVNYNEIPKVTATFYPKDKEMIPENEVTQIFELVVKE